ncbi:MAG: hypothetical protein ACQETE_09230 [Bacteroidota bacterium]|jgi:hypothetical protein
MKIRSSFLLTLFGIAFLTLTGCNGLLGSDDDDHEDHLEPVAMELYEDGTEIARYENGSVTGSITVDAESTTGTLTVYYLDADGDRITIDEPEFELRFENIDTAIAQIDQQPADGRWSFRIEGISSGSTEVAIELWHGDEHAALKPAPIPITVN